MTSEPDPELMALIREQHGEMKKGFREWPQRRCTSLDKQYGQDGWSLQEALSDDRRE